jgi:hypothetical protein
MLPLGMVEGCVIQLKGIYDEGAVFTDIKLGLGTSEGRDLALSNCVGHLFFWFLHFLLCSFSIQDLFPPRNRTGYLPLIHFQFSVLLISWYLSMHISLLLISHFLLHENTEQHY